MRDDEERRAKKLFKRDHPDRYWDLTAKPRIIGSEVESQHASDREKDHYRTLAREEKQSEDLKAANATRT